MYIEYRRGVSPQSKPVALALAYMLNFLCAGSGCCPLMMECTREANTQQTQKSFENYTQTPIFFSSFYRLPYGRAFHSFSLFNGGSGGGGVVGNDEAKMLLFRLLIVHWAMGSRFFSTLWRIYVICVILNVHRAPPFPKPKKAAQRKVTPVRFSLLL